MENIEIRTASLDDYKCTAYSEGVCLSAAKVKYGNGNYTDGGVLASELKKNDCRHTRIGI
ncbi:MAG: hypothetical protein J6C37_00900 [Roseburia sp.]|nr:hypothetical protein [Roseburia sp.]